MRQTISKQARAGARRRRAAARARGRGHRVAAPRLRPQPASAPCPAARAPPPRPAAAACAPPHPLTHSPSPRPPRPQEGPRWADAFTRPGQFVALRPLGAPPLPPALSRKAALKASPLVLPIASSPYATRRDSAFLDAAIIELLVDDSHVLQARGCRPVAGRLPAGWPCLAGGGRCGARAGSARRGRGRNAR